MAIELPPASAPDAPRALGAIAVGGDQIDLSWQAPQNVTSPIYRIYWDKGLGYLVFVPKTSVRGTKYSSDGLEPLTTYRYLVTVYDGRSESSPVFGQAQTYSWLRLPLLQFARQSAAGPLPLKTSLPTPTSSVAQDTTQGSEVILGLMTTADYVDDVGTLHLLGEVQNDTAHKVNQVRVRVTFYGDSGEVLETTTGSALLDLLAPGQLSPFVIVWENPPEWKRYSLRATARPTMERAQEGLTLVQSYARLDDSGLYHVVGTIKNEGLITADYTRVVVSLYDSFGKIANAGFAYVQPSSIPPGTTGRFDCLFDHYPYRAEHMVQISPG
jgi:hypothetical protein